MALPKVCNKPTPKRVAAYAMRSAIRDDLTGLIERIEDNYGVVMSDKQRADVLEQYEQFADRVEKHVLGKSL